MSDDPKPGGGPIAQRMRELLCEDAELSPPRLELGRRRLALAVASRARGRRRLRIGAAAAAGLAAAAVIALAVSTPREGEGTRALAGLTRVAGAGGLGPGRAVVPAGSGAVLDLGGGTALWLAEGSAVSAQDGGRSLRLESGRALARVAKRRPAEPFVLRTPCGDVEVRGTVFSARLSGSSLVVDLYEGAVRLVGAGGAADVAPGESVRVRADGSIAWRGPIDRAAVLADLLIAEKTAGLPGVDLPRLAPSAVDAPAPVPAPPAPAIAPPAPQEPAASTPRPRPKRAEPRPAPPPAPESPPATAPLALPAPPEAPPLETIAAEPAPPADEALFLDAYEKAQSGAPADARALLEQYLASFPEGRYWRRVAEILGEEPPRP